MVLGQGQVVHLKHPAKHWPDLVQRLIKLLLIFLKDKKLLKQSAYKMKSSQVSVNRLTNLYEMTKAQTQKFSKQTLKRMW